MPDTTVSANEPGHSEDSLRGTLAEQFLLFRMALTESRFGRGTGSRNRGSCLLLCVRLNPRLGRLCRACNAYFIQSCLVATEETQRYVGHVVGNDSDARLIDILSHMV